MVTEEKVILVACTAEIVGTMMLEETVTVLLRACSPWPFWAR